MGVSTVMGVPQNGWFIRENAMNMDDDWWYPYFRKPPYDAIWCPPVLVGEDRVMLGFELCRLPSFGTSLRFGINIPCWMKRYDLMVTCCCCCCCGVWGRREVCMCWTWWEGFTRIVSCCHASMPRSYCTTMFFFHPAFPTSLHLAWSDSPDTQPAQPAQWLQESIPGPQYNYSTDSFKHKQPALRWRSLMPGSFQPLKEWCWSTGNQSLTARFHMRSQDRAI